MKPKKSQIIFLTLMIILSFYVLGDTYKVDNDYLCNAAVISECCGASTNTCMSWAGGTIYGGERNITGEGPIDLAGQKYYCADDGDWTTNLDAKSQYSCETYGYPYTGSKCCGEVDNSNEYYNDSVSGCWNSTQVLSGDFPYLRTKIKDVVFFINTFYGCKIDAVNYLNENEYLLDLINNHTKLPLIENKDYCFTIDDGYYYCAYTENWTEGGEAEMQLTHVPWDIDDSDENEREAGCCGLDKCFNGSACIDNQVDDIQNSGFNGYRCVDGGWGDAIKVCAPDEVTCGYCPRNDQCLLNLQGTAADNDDLSGNPQCIANGQYVGDDYCENGAWTSRTKWVAVQLLDLAGGNYALFCGEYEEVLNYLDYIVTGAKIARNYAVETNNYCVLTSGGKVVFGTSINDGTDTEFEDVVGESCSSVTQEDGLYHACTGSKRVWYNKKLKSVIYSQSQLALSDASGKSGTYLDNPFISLINKLSVKFPDTHDGSFDSDTLYSDFKFRNLYLAGQNQKFVLGSIKGEFYRNLVIEYLNFNTNVCKLMNAYNQSYSDFMSGIFCSKENKNYYALAQGSEFTALDPSIIWSDLTGKLRVG